MLFRCPGASRRDVTSCEKKSISTSNINDIENSQYIYIYTVTVQYSIILYNNMMWCDDKRCEGVSIPQKTTIAALVQGFYARLEVRLRGCR